LFPLGRHVRDNSALFKVLKTIALYFATMSNCLSWERKTLSNGLVVLLDPRPSALTAQVYLAVRYGSNDDNEDEAGTAHMLEHMLVGGSQQRIKLHHEIEALGGYPNFETSREYTFSMVDVVPEALVKASQVLSDLVFDPTFQNDKLKHERKVIISEIAESSDDPIGKNEETFIKCLFKQHPVKNPILGSERTVKKIELADIEKAHQKFYSTQKGSLPNMSSSLLK
jgi:predicted Zn-dependent peptidase